MYFHLQNLINPIEQDEPDPAAANALQEGLGGQFGEMCTMMQYLFQSTIGATAAMETADIDLTFGKLA